MSKISKTLIKTGVYSCAIGAILAVIALFVVQSGWFREKVRQRIISAVEEASGGRVELGGFSYNWRALTATFQNFVIHGTEPSSSPPLFRASSVQVQLHVLSVFERKVAVSSVFVLQPDIYILVRSDGSTNIPAPRARQKSAERTIQDLLNLKLRHFELRRGSIQTDQQQIPLNVRGEDTAVVLSYDRRGPSYLAKVTARQVYLNSQSFQPIGMTMSAQVRLEKNSLILETSDFASGSSKIYAAGSLRSFNHPVVDLQVNADLGSTDVARIAAIPELRAGRIRFAGAFHRDTGAPFSLSGKINAQQLAIQARGYALKNCEFASQVSASMGRFNLSTLSFRTPWGQLTGNAAILHNKEFSFAGHVAGVNAIEAERFFLQTEVPLPALATGALEINGVLGKSFRDFIVRTNIDLNSPSGSVPMASHIEATYHQLGNTVDLANSQLNFPHTHLAVSGRVGQNLNAVLDTTNLDDLRPLQHLAPNRFASIQWPNLLTNGSAHFDGTIAGSLNLTHISGHIALNRFTILGETWDQVRAYADVSSESATLTGLSIDQGAMHASGSAHLQLTGWLLNRNAPVSLQLQFRNATVTRIAEFARLGNLHLVGASASGAIKLQGRLDDPQGTAQLKIQNLRAFNQRLDQATADLQLLPGEIRIANGRVQTGSALLAFSGSYTHAPASWSNGQLHLKADSNVFPLTTIALARQYEPGWNAQVELHGDAGVKIDGGHIEPTVANGVLVLHRVTQGNEALGDVTLDASTKGEFLYAGFSGDLRESHVKGNAEVHLIPGTPAKGQLQIDRIGLRTLYALFDRATTQTLPFDGFVRGAATFEGPLQQPEHITGAIHLDDLQVSAAGLLQSATSTAAPALIFRNSSPIFLDIANGRLSVRSFQLAGRDTNLALKGSIAYLHQTALNLQADGQLDLRIFQLFQLGVQTSGRSLISASITGTLATPAVNGTLEIQNGSLFANGFPNGLTAINGAFRFDRDRATIQKLTAQTGGGTLSATGFVDFSAGGPVIYRLEATAENVRVRYANSVSVTATSQLRLAGTSRNSVLSGTATVARVVFTPNADVGTLLAAAAAPSASTTKENDFLTGLQLDIQIESAPDLQVTTELSRDVQAEIDLHLRGTPEHPVLLGDIVANQGDIKVFGGKYSINRGEIRFVNAARIEPVLDLDLQTEARGITVDITIAGTIGKLNINYRSDPPLQPRDIIALLTVGRAPDTAAINPNVQTTNDTSAMQYGADTVLGQAISPVSNRLSKLFGITNIKIDPLVQGITNAPQARLTLEQQISREITVTYVTNLSETSEQIFRLEWAFSPQYSLVALRDDNGEFGIDIQYKKRFK